MSCGSTWAETTLLLRRDDLQNDQLGHPPRPKVDADRWLLPYPNRKLEAVTPPKMFCWW